MPHNILIKEIGDMFTSLERGGEGGLMTAVNIEVGNFAQMHMRAVVRDLNGTNRQHCSL